MQVVQEWPILQAKAKTGKTKYWQASVGIEGDDVLVCVEFWQGDGVHQKQAKKIQGKNIGRSNETSPLEQAISEAESQINKQKDKGYSTDGQFISIYTLPMLAQDYKARANKIDFPCFGQPKLDGVRCLFNTNRGFWSRQGKPFNAVDLSHLGWETIEEITLDGELILPKPYTFQETVSAIKKQNDLTPLLEYHVFDLVVHGTFLGRWLNFWKRVEDGKYPLQPRQLYQVPTELIENTEDIQKRLFYHLSEGYEGIILRNFIGEYEIGQRSVHLQKYKLFVDEEFAICGVIDGVGKEEGAAIFVCASKVPGKFFNVRPKGSYEDRRVIFDNGTEYTGKWLTVRYQNLTDDGIPRFPVGISVRDYE